MHAISSYRNHLAMAVSMLCLVLLVGAPVEAEQQGETLVKEKNLQLEFDEHNPEGNIDLKQIVDQELQTPIECLEAEAICQISRVSFDITIKKEWLKLDMTTLSNHAFAQTVPKISNPMDQLSKAEVVVVQETLARRGLLQYLDGSTVQERGFFGSLTWLGLVRLAQIKGLDPGQPEFEQQLTDEINNLLDNMANDEDYVENRALPAEEMMTPGQQDPLAELWDHYNYVAELAEDAQRVNPGEIPLNLGDDVSIDGYLNVERID